MKTISIVITDSATEKEVQEIVKLISQVTDGLYDDRHVMVDSKHALGGLRKARDCSILEDRAQQAADIGKEYELCGAWTVPQAG